MDGGRGLRAVPSPNHGNGLLTPCESGKASDFLETKPSPLHCTLFSAQVCLPYWLEFLRGGVPRPGSPKSSTGPGSCAHWCWWTEGLRANPQLPPQLGMCGHTKPSSALWMARQSPWAERGRVDWGSPLGLKPDTWPPVLTLGIVAQASVSSPDIGVVTASPPRLESDWPCGAPCCGEQGLKGHCPAGAPVPPQLGAVGVLTGEDTARKPVFPGGPRVFR